MTRSRSPPANGSSEAQQPGSNQRQRPDPQKLTIKWTETRDRKDESRSWTSFAIDPITNLKVMSTVQPKLRAIKKGKLQPLKTGQIEYATMGGCAREFGGTTFYGGSIDGRVLWGKFGGYPEKLKDDLAAKTGLPVVLINQSDIEPITITVESTTSTEEALGASANHSRTSSSSSLPDLVGFSSSSCESSDDELPELESIEDGAVECRKCRPFPASNGCRPCRFSWPDLDLDQAARSSGESSDDDMPELESLFCVLADAARDARPLCSDILSFEHRFPELN